ncbi:glycosyltransferase, partial [bacterium]|nr:glycosyltransferase [bacterium]
SSDGTLSILEAFQRKHPDRVRILRNDQNLGIPGTKNRLLDAAKDYEFIVYHDQDDISLPERVETQVNYLKTHPDVVAVGGWIEIFNSETNEKHIRTYAADHDTLVKSILRCSPLAQPTVALRVSALSSVRSRAQYGPCEDYDMWLRIGATGKLANIQQVLLKYRDHPNSTTRAKLVAMEKFALQIRYEHVRGGLYRPSLFDLLFNLAQLTTMKLFPADVRMRFFNFIRAKGLI